VETTSTREVVSLLFWKQNVGIGRRDIFQLQVICNMAGTSTWSVNVASWTNG